MVKTTFLQNTAHRGFRFLKAQIWGHIGILPDFLIIGEKKCGTTSLYNYLVQHPCIYPASTKEVGFFDRYWHRKDILWYRSHFPSLFRKYYRKNILKRDFITGEASTGYILNPHVLKRIARLLPQVKLILVLRNPVDRAYSHYNHSVRGGRETLPFEVAIRKEEERIGKALKRMIEDENYHFDINIAYYSYLFTGIYIDRVEVLMSLFPKERILILRYEDMVTDPSTVYERVLRFLNVPIVQIEDFPALNKGEYQQMDSMVRGYLHDYFRLYNKKLYDFLGVNFHWDNDSVDPVTVRENHYKKRIKTASNIQTEESRNVVWEEFWKKWYPIFAPFVFFCLVSLMGEFYDEKNKYCIFNVYYNTR